MVEKTRKKPIAKRMLAVRLPDNVLVALHERAAQDRRTLTVTIEMALVAGLAVLGSGREGKSA
jgi:hypothetical protein